MDYRKLFRGTYIAAAEFAGHEPTLTIREFTRVVLEEEGGWQHEKPVIYFRELEQGWLLNATSAQCLGAMFGVETKVWLGKKVTLTAALVECGEGYRVGVRVKGSPHLVDTIDAPIELRGFDRYYMRLVPTPRTWLRSVA